MIHRLLQAHNIESYDLSSLRLILYAGASMPVELLKRALAVFPWASPSFTARRRAAPLRAA